MDARGADEFADGLEQVFFGQLPDGSDMVIISRFTSCTQGCWIQRITIQQKMIKDLFYGPIQVLSQLP